MRIRESIVIDAPRDRVFDYLADIANHAAFSDHYLKEFRLGRLDSYGEGASARFLIKAPLRRTWGESQIVEMVRPQLVREEGRTGRIGRNLAHSAYAIKVASSGMTEVELEIVTEPGTKLDGILESMGRGWLARQVRKALRRLRDQVEEGPPAAPPVSVDGRDPAPLPYGRQAA